MVENGISDMAPLPTACLTVIRAGTVMKFVALIVFNVLLVSLFN